LLTSTPFLRVVNSKRVKLRFLVSVLNDTVLEMTVLVRLLSGTGLRSASGIGGGAVGGFSFTMVRCCLVQRLRRKDVANFLDKMTVNSEIVGNGISQLLTSDGFRTLKLEESGEGSHAKPSTRTTEQVSRSSIPITLTIGPSYFSASKEWSPPPSLSSLNFDFLV
jgi:hypothetical protein